MIGTRAAAISCVMPFVISTDPPGVSSSITSAAAPLASASSIARERYDARTGVTGPWNRASLTGTDCALTGRLTRASNSQPSSQAENTKRAPRRLTMPNIPLR